jgi:hypothetical protein
MNAQLTGGLTKISNDYNVRRGSQYQRRVTKKESFV